MAVGSHARITLIPYFHEKPPLLELALGIGRGTKGIGARRHLHEIQVNATRSKEAFKSWRKKQLRLARYEGSAIPTSRPCHPLSALINLALDSPVDEHRSLMGTMSV